MTIRVLLLLIVSAIFGLPAGAQVDTDFWFVAPEITIQHADRPVFLRISTLQNAATVTISLPSNASFTPVTRTIAANSTVSINLTNQIEQIENKPFNAILNYGMYISATSPITAYYEVLGTSSFGIVNCDIFVLKGHHALGNEFYVPFQTHWDNSRLYGLNDAWASFDIVATENNTSVTITPSKNIMGHAAGIPFTITLQRGQTYSARAASLLAAEHPSGSHITSSKPIAVTTKDDSILENPNYDLAGDQIIPLDYIGKEYIAVKISGTSNTDRLFIVGTKAGTTLSINGVTAATINAGETYEFPLLSPTAYISASDSVYVWHVGGFNSELGGAILPPLGCTGSRQVSFTRSNNEAFFIEIVVKSGYEQYFKLNGSNVLVPAAAFTTVPSTSGIWKYAKIPLDDDVITSGSTNLIRNDSADFQMSTLNGGPTTGFRYGYFSDFGFLELGSDKGFCEGNNITLDAGFYQDSITWNTGSHNQYLTVSDTGYYSVKTKKGVCVNQDTVHLFYYPKILSDVLGNDTAGCANSGLTITTLFPFSSYEWSNGSTESNIAPDHSGDYTVLVKNQFGCSKKDTLDVTIYPVPNPFIMYDTGLESFCKNPLVSLEANEVYSKYYWSTGDTTKAIVTLHNEKDSFALRVTNNFGCSEATAMSIDCSPVIGLVPNLLTPNEDGKNDVFYIEYLRTGKWILEVYNRWGDRVYKNDGYDNTFNPKELSDGIYYFSFRHKEGKGENKGWLQVIR